jgi:Protein of unknown function (DUF1360).
VGQRSCSMIRITDQYFWNFVFSLFFLCLVFMGTVILDSEAYKPYSELTVLDLALIALASHRLIRLFVYDVVTKWFREQFYDVKELKTKVTLHKPATGPRRTIIELMNCPWCFGVWITALVTFCYLLTPLAFYPVLLLALASVATTLQLFTNWLGHSAERAKRLTDFS